MSTSGRSVRARRRGGTAAAKGPAQKAAARLSAVNVVLAVLAFASVLLILTRLLESWRIGGGRTPDAVLLGQRLSYPTANAGAITVAVLALLGLIVLSAVVYAGARELRADARFRRAIARRTRGSVQGALVVDEVRPQAFCAGLLRPRVYVSRGALEILSDAELAAVLAHERHHAAQRDPLRLTSARLLAAGLFFVPPLRRAVERQHSLAEIGADEAAVGAAGGDRAPLASAMLTFSEASGGAGAGLAPERVDHLVGEGYRWRLPVVLVLVISFCLAFVVTAAVLAAETARGSATLAPPLVSARPCVVMLALIPACLAAAGLLFVRARARSDAVLAQPGAARS
jgi:Zn-dependent protease with chaperone function